MNSILSKSGMFVLFLGTSCCILLSAEKNSSRHLYDILKGLRNLKCGRLMRPLNKYFCNIVTRMSDNKQDTALPALSA